ncbi:venom carboxylesterase-6-like [Diorhabda sublineata]|uniref:venom carboxylesterase-6-like n=1 Tax=Diorhabda sublineata TaxID=1163346 RepID=UPI0024E15555|nr:venom carboxylesterase-6-like [Diorhabda sublineata]
MFFKIVLLLFTTSQVFCDDDLLVTLPNGKLRGISLTAPITGNLTYYAYLRIPFAAPPVGNLRFQPPQPPANWEGILEANNVSVSCYQVQATDKYESEDCLYLHVYSPVKPTDTRKLPVVVEIYGGTFLKGHASYNNKAGAFLMSYGVVLVTFNYRVGPFGFLSTGDTVIPGNMGLKDQQAALRWIQQNIEYFGGDPQKVTIMGQSAGSASVTYQLLSPGSAGLFRAAIGNSGSALCNWANKMNAVDTAYGIAAEIDPSFDRSRSTQELADFLLSVDASAIVSTQYHFYVFPPVLEVPHDGAFITESMYTLVETGAFNKVPVLMGFNSEEYISKGKDMNLLAKYAQQFDNNPRLLVDGDMSITDDAVKLEVGQKIRQIYAGDGLLVDNLGKLIQYYSDNTFIRAIIKFADLVSHHVNVYLYEFTYHGEIGGQSIYVPGIGRVGHGEEQKYFWANFDSYDQYPESDRLVQQRYIRLLVNFITYLNPTPANDELFGNVIWSNAQSPYFSYMDIGENLVLMQNPRNFSYVPWVELYEQYAKKPFISY